MVPVGNVNAVSDTIKTISKIEGNLNLLLDKEYISESTVAFFRDIVRAQDKVKHQLRKELTFTLTEDQINDKLQEGLPLISHNDLPLTPSYLRPLFQEMCTIMLKQKESDVAVIRKLLDAEEKGTLDLRALIEKLVTHDDLFFQSLSRKLELGEDLLLYCALQLAKPFFEAAAERLQGKVADERWLKHCCPVCGGSAQVARIEKEAGKRILSCLLCGSEWRFMRVKCSFCCNEDQKTLKFIEEEKGPYRIDVCERCKRYVKTLDERKGGGGREDFIPSVEDLATMYLDMVAEKEGYFRSWFFPPLVEQLRDSGEGKTLH